MSSRSSYGDGRHMTIKEAVERRARMIRFHGSLEAAYRHGHPYITADQGRNEMSRAWNSWFCRLQLESGNGFECTDWVFGAADTHGAEDVAFDNVMLEDGEQQCIVAACPSCRGAT